MLNCKKDNNVFCDKRGSSKNDVRICSYDGNHSLKLMQNKAFTSLVQLSSNICLTEQPSTRRLNKHLHQNIIYSPWKSYSKIVKGSQEQISINKNDNLLAKKSLLMSKCKIKRNGKLIKQRNRQIQQNEQNNQFALKRCQRQSQIIQSGIKQYSANKVKNMTQGIQQSQSAYIRNLQNKSFQVLHFTKPKQDGSIIINKKQSVSNSIMTKCISIECKVKIKKNENDKQNMQKYKSANKLEYWKHKAHTRACNKKRKQFIINSKNKISEVIGCSGKLINISAQTDQNFFGNNNNQNLVSRVLRQKFLHLINNDNSNDI